MMNRTSIWTLPRDEMAYDTAELGEHELVAVPIVRFFSEVFTSRKQLER